MQNVELKRFNNHDFGSIRVLEMNGEPWFIGKDVAKALGYSNTSDALSKHVDREDKLQIAKHDLLNQSDIGTKGAVIINESGLYSLILSSKLPNAKKFKRWVTSEVLPSIRKTGNYVSDKERLQLQLFSDDKLVVVHAHKELIKLEKAPLLAQLEEQAPDVVFARAIGNSSTLISVAELATLMNQNGIEIGRNRLFEWLRVHGYLVKQKGERRNLPTQKSTDLGVLKMVESPAKDYHGEDVINKVAKVTPKGQQYFLNKFLLEEKKGA